MQQVDLNQRPNALLFRQKQEDDLTKRLIQVAIPFLYLYRPAAVVTTTTLGAIQAYKVISAPTVDQDPQGKPKSSKVKELSGIVASVGLGIFSPRWSAVLSASVQLHRDYQEYTEGKASLSAVLGSAVRELFQVGSMFYGKPHLIAASLLIQAAFDARDAKDEFKKGRYLEAGGKLAMAILRAWSGANQAKTAWRTYQRDRLWSEVESLDTGLSREEFDAIVNYAESHELVSEPTRINGREQGLARSVTVTPNSDIYVHLKRHIGNGSFKDVYTCLKIHKGHPKLMAEMIVYRDAAMAIREEELATTLNSPYISGGAEISYQNGGDLCMITELMDGDGRHLRRDPDITAGQRIQTMIDVSKGLSELHEAGYIHHDLYDRNILYSKNSQPVGKLSDLGLAKQADSRWAQEEQGWDLTDLADLVDDVCSPVFEHYSEVASGADLQNLSRAIAAEKIQPLPASEWSERLQGYLSQLGDTAVQPVYSREDWPEFCTTLEPLRIPVAKPVRVDVTPPDRRSNTVGWTSTHSSWLSSTWKTWDSHSYDSSYTDTSWLDWPNWLRERGVPTSTYSDSDDYTFTWTSDRNWGVGSWARARSLARARHKPCQQPTWVSSASKESCLDT